VQTASRRVAGVHGTAIAPQLRVPTIRHLVLAPILATALACASPCRDAHTRSELHEFERDHERCEDQARKLAGNISVGDYRSCMRVRGWCRAPEGAASLR
jgi:hypothetical protein